MSKITTYHQNLFRIKLTYSLELTISQKKNEWAALASLCSVDRKTSITHSSSLGCQC